MPIENVIMKIKAYLLLTVAGVLLFVVFLVGRSASSAPDPSMKAATQQQPTVLSPTMSSILPPVPANRMQVDAHTQEMAEKTAAFIAYNTRIGPILQNDNPKVSAADFRQLMQDTDRLQEGHYLTLGESYAIKEKLLRSQYGGAELQGKLQELQQSIAATRERLAAEGDPSRDPAFREYKAREEEVLRQADNMSSFPDGMSKEQYVLKQLGVSP